MCLVDSGKKGLAVAYRASFPSFLWGHLGRWDPAQSVLRTQKSNQALPLLVWVTCLLKKGRRNRGGELITDRLHHFGFKELVYLHKRGSPPPHTIHFQDKVSFMRALCWTNQVNWGALNSSHLVDLFFLLETDSVVGDCTYFTFSYSLYSFLADSRECKLQTLVNMWIRHVCIYYIDNMIRITCSSNSAILSMSSEK